MSTALINKALSNTKPRYAQINLCSSLLQETRDTQISPKPIQLSHNHEDRKIHQNHADLLLRLVIKLLQ